MRPADGAESPTIAGGGGYRLRYLSRLCRAGVAQAPRTAGAVLAAGILVIGADLAVYGLGPASPGYITAPIERGVIASIVRATGRVEAIGSVDVSSQLSGRIERVFVSFNDPVKAGEPLAELDRGIFIAHLNETEAAVKVAKAKVQIQRATVERARLAVAKAATDRQLAQNQSAGFQARQGEAERELQRKLALARTGSAPERELSQARAASETAVAEARAALDQVALKAQTAGMVEVEVRMAEADLANAEATVEQQEAARDQAHLDLERSVLRAPIDGVVIKRDVNPGQTVAVTLEAKTLFTIANDLSRMEVHGKIDEADIGKLQSGQTVHFTVDAFPDRDFSGEVLQVRKAPETTQNVVTYAAIVSALNPDLVLYPGMTATLRVTVNRTGEVLKVPTQALHFRPPGPAEPLAAATAATSSGTIWLLGQDGRPTRLAVGSGLSDETSTEVRATSLNEGQRAIVGIADTPSSSGFFGLRLAF